MLDAVERLNVDCLCRTVDVVALGAALEREVGDAGFAAELTRTHPGLVSRQPVFLSATHATRMQEIITAIEAVVRLPAFRDGVLAHAPEIARFDPGPIGIFMGYDFHLGPDGPQLIEINTNAGGALINAHLAEAQRACCGEFERLLARRPGLAQITDGFVAAVQSEWRRQGIARPLARIAIVDADPATQFLYPEFRLFQRLFERHGLAAVIADPADLVWRDGALTHQGQRVDLVYNRMTDFGLDGASAADLRTAYLAGAVAVTPNPRAHALYADKRNLVPLTNRALLAEWGVVAGNRDVLISGIAGTELVTPARGDELWQGRAKLFFKPARGYGSRAAYRGDKLTKRVWADILEGDYVAQALVQPSGRGVNVDGERHDMKVDIRCYAYDGTVQLLAARLYQGQTTNMRTAGGGFAPVLSGEASEGMTCTCSVCATR
jgi:hypothetical protein